MVTYQDNACAVTRYGAPLGRAKIDNETPGPISVGRVVLDGDYDCNGTYWGGGEGTQPLFWASSTDSAVDYVLRAESLQIAIEAVREAHPGVEVVRGAEQGILINDVELDSFAQAYLECALWSSVDDDGDPLDAKFSVDDLESEVLQKAVQECRAFQESNEADLVELDPAQAGHDFWLTRNGHGAGFWDRGLGELGDRLTEASKAAGTVNLIVSEGKAYYE